MSNITQSFGDMVAVRDVAGKYIAKLGKISDKVVVVNADLMGTSRNKWFVEEFPDRSFNVGIAEQNLVSFSAGLAHEGFSLMRLQWLRLYLCALVNRLEQMWHMAN